MSDRMQMLEEIMPLLSKYSKMQPWRPGLIDLYVYDIMLGMYESDYEDVDNMSWVWTKKPDEVMQHIIDSPRIFDLEYGWESLDEDIRDYLSQEGFLVDVDDISEEELQANLERK